MSLNDDDRNETITEWGRSCWRQSSTSNVRQHNGWCGSKVNDATPNSIFFDAIPSPVFLPRFKIMSWTPPTIANKSFKNNKKQHEFSTSKSDSHDWNISKKGGTVSLGCPSVLLSRLFQGCVNSESGDRQDKQHDTTLALLSWWTFSSVHRLEPKQFPSSVVVVAQTDWWKIQVSTTPQKQWRVVLVYRPVYVSVWLSNHEC